MRTLRQKNLTKTWKSYIKYTVYLNRYGIVAYYIFRNLAVYTQQNEIHKGIRLSNVISQTIKQQKYISQCKILFYLI